MDAIFLRTIRSEPGNPTHPLIYADWLEEQGNPKGRLVRLWQQAVYGEAEERATAHEELGRGLSALVGVIEQLTQQQQRLLACDCARRTLRLLDDDLVQQSQLWEALEATRRFARGELSETEIADAFATLRDQAGHPQNYQEMYLPVSDVRDAVSSAMRGAWRAALHSSRLALDDDPAYRRTGRYVQADAIEPVERQRQLLIALSYHLFDQNCCPADL